MYALPLFFKYGRFVSVLLIFVVDVVFVNVSRFHIVVSHVLLRPTSKSSLKMFSRPKLNRLYATATQFIYFIDVIHWNVTFNPIHGQSKRLCELHETSICLRSEGFRFHFAISQNQICVAMKIERKWKTLVTCPAFYVHILIKYAHKLCDCYYMFCFIKIIVHSNSHSNAKNNLKRKH